MPVARFHRSLVSDLPGSYLLRTEEEARSWAKALVERYTDREIAVFSIELMTLYDAVIADAGSGAWGPSRDPDDTPVWRVEFDGAPLPHFPMRCGSPGSTASCPEGGRTVIWVRASNADFNGYTFRPDGQPSSSELATPMPTPAPSLGVPVDPTLPLLADADVVHIVSVSEGRLRFVQSESEGDTPLTTETWLNRTTGEAVVRQTRASGALESLTILRGMTLDRYLAESYNGLTDAPVYTHLRTDALSVDDPAIHLSTAQLDWYRDALARGHAYVLGSEEYDGQPALKVQVAAGTDAQHIAYLDPQHLLPLAVVITNTSAPEQAGVVEKITYLAIESFGAGDIPARAFDVEPPATADVPREILSQQLTLDDARMYDDYPLWSPGASLPGYDLVAIERYAETGDGTAQEDFIRFVYQRGENRDARIQIICYGRLMDATRGEYIQHRADNSEEIATSTGPAWLQERANQDGVRVDLDRDGTLILISAPDRDSAIAAADALQRINGE